MIHPFSVFAKSNRYQPAPIPVLSAREGDEDEDKDEDQLSKGQVTAINTIVHKAIGSRLSSQSFKDSIGKIAGEAAADAITTATEGLSGKLDSLLAAKPSDDDDKSGKGAAPAFKDSDEYKALMQRDKDRKAEHDKLLKEREDEKNARDRQEERSLLEAELRKQGVPEVKLRSCVATLIHEDKVMQRNADGKVVYQIKHDDYNEDLSVSEGVKKFIETDEGKAFMPPAGASGTGAVGNSDEKGKTSQTGGKAQTKDEAAAVVTDWLAGQ